MRDEIELERLFLRAEKQRKRVERGRNRSLNMRHPSAYEAARAV